MEGVVFIFLVSVCPGLAIPLVAHVLGAVKPESALAVVLRQTVVSPCFVGRISYWPGAHQIALGILLVSFPGVGVTTAFFLSHFILMTCFKVFSQKCLFLFLLFCSAEDETLGLACARPELYRRATPPGRGTRCYIRLL